MSRTKSRKVFVIRDQLGRNLFHVIARHGKGALAIARQHDSALSGAIAFEVDESKAALAINKPEAKA